MIKNIKVNENYALSLNHKYDKKMDLHHINIKRLSDDEHPINDVDFFLETEKFVQFCEFFKNIG